jgi:hypothetical protein
MRRAVRRALVAVAVVVAGLTSLSATPAGAGVVGPNPEVDRWAYWGYLWSDGRFSNGLWTWDQNPYYFPASGARFIRGAIQHRIWVDKKASNNTYRTATKPHPPLPDMRGKPALAIQAFLSAVIEDEGVACTGLVEDDPKRDRLVYIKQLLAAVGVPSWIRSNRAGTFHELFVARQYWSILRSWPYATMARTPGSC